MNNKDDEESVGLVGAFLIRDYFIINDQELPLIPDIVDHMEKVEARGFIMYLISIIEDLLYPRRVEGDIKAIIKRRLLECQNEEGDFENDVKMYWTEKDGFVPKIKNN